MRSQVVHEHGRAKVRTSNNTMEVRVDDELVVTRFKNREYTTHSTDLGLLMAAFSALLSAEGEWDQ